jgi:hypothetical protein
MIKLLDEAYLDDNEEFYDYETQDNADVDKKDIFDITAQETSYGRQFLDPKLKDYLRDEKNQKAEIVYMSPEEYYKQCAKLFNTTIDNLKEQRRADKETLEHLKQVILKYHRKFPLCYIDYTRYAAQEGLHRMMVAGDLCGWDTKFPVLIIKHYDEDEAKRREDYKKERQYINKLNDALYDAKRYKYKADNFIEDFKEQIEFELNKYMNDEDQLTVTVSDLIEDNYTDPHYEVALDLYPNSPVTVWLDDLNILSDEDVKDYHDKADSIVSELKDSDVLYDVMDDYSIDDLINMSDEEFDRLLDEYSK